MSLWMLRLAGGGLLTLTGALLGASSRRRLRRQRDRLTALNAALGRLAGELTTLCAPLPDSFARLADCPFFALLSAGFGTAPLTELWRRAAEAQPVPPEAAERLAALGDVVGRYDAVRQAAEIALVREALAASAAALERELTRRAARYPGLGAALGAMLAVLLF